VEKSEKTDMGYSVKVVVILIFDHIEP